MIRVLLLLVTPSNQRKTLTKVVALVLVGMAVAVGMAEFGRVGSDMGSPVFGPDFMEGWW